MNVSSRLFDCSGVAIDIGVKELRFDSRYSVTCARLLFQELAAADDELRHRYKILGKTRGCTL